jgi:prepilin-type processing-associated H-X9-DG protein
MEQLQYHPAGEWGKLLGLDRIPKVRTIRNKVKGLAVAAVVGAWGKVLSHAWMVQDPEAAGVLYVDGHVRVYHGAQTKLPRRYVSRQRLCLRGTTDTWVNDQWGRPFFVISSPLTPGLLDTLKQFLDTIKMIAYRAETAMAGILRTADARTDETRALLREIFSTDADLFQDEAAGTLTVRLHHLTNRTSDTAACHLAEQLNATETVYPGTNLRVVYKLVSD